MALVLTRLASLPLLLRVWEIMLFANVLGAFVLANSHVLSPAATATGASFTKSGLEYAWWDVFFKALFAGWLVAGVVWLSIAARDTISCLLLIYGVFYVIATAELYHVVTAAADALFFLFLDVPGPGSFTVFYEFWLPVLLGNTAGGVFSVALVNYGQSEQQRFPGIRELTVREVLFSWHGGRSHTTPCPSADEDESGTE